MALPCGDPARIILFKGGLGCPVNGLRPSTGTADRHDALDDCANCSTRTYNPFSGYAGECFPCALANQPGTADCEGCDPGRHVANVSANNEPK